MWWESEGNDGVRDVIYEGMTGVELISVVGVSDVR